jgi:hypothetical protein
MYDESKNTDDTIKEGTMLIHSHCTLIQTQDRHPHIYTNHLLGALGVRARSAAFLLCSIHTCMNIYITMLC